MVCLQKRGNFRINLYNFVTNNPVNLIDLFGLNPEIWARDLSGRRPDFYSNEYTECEKKANRRALEKTRDALDTFGLVPGLGILGDAASLPLSLSIGDWGNAGLSIGTMVPLFGQAVGVGKLIKNSAKYGDKIIDVAKNSDLL